MHYFFYFKQINYNLDRFANTSSSDTHRTTMDIDLESFNHRKQRKISKEASKVKF